jgi:hypothetical protein
MANDDWTAKPFAPWLEDTIRELVKVNPVAIAMEMVDETGLVSTCYYDTSPNDRACMIDAMRDDARWAFIRDNREEILALLNDEDDDEDELQDADTETDCEDG